MEAHHTSIVALASPISASLADLCHRQKERSLRDARRGVGNSDIAKRQSSLARFGIPLELSLMSRASDLWQVADSTHRYSIRPQATMADHLAALEHAFPEESREKSISDSLLSWRYPNLISGSF